MAKMYPKSGYVRKFKKGKVITSMNELDMLMDAKEFVYWNNKPCHPSWLGSMTFHTLKGAINSKILSRTEENK